MAAGSYVKAMPLCKETERNGGVKILDVSHGAVCFWLPFVQVYNPQRMRGELVEGPPLMALLHQEVSGIQRQA